MSGNASVTLATDVAELQVSTQGGVITSLVIAGIEILKQGDGYGCFPMAPWCGRMRHGRLSTPSAGHQLPLNEGPHAIHGTSRDGTWRIVESSSTTATLVHQLASPWPFEGQVTQQFDLSDDGLDLVIQVAAGPEPFPAQAGWHPWFKRHLRDDAEPVAIDFSADWQELRGPDYLPTGQRIEPQRGPWDDCFSVTGGVDVVLTWPDQLRLSVRSPEQWVVVYDMEADAVCVEPQSGPPNGINTDPRLVTAHAPLRVESTWRWQRRTALSRFPGGSKPYS